MINAQDIKIGTCIRMDGKLYFCIDFLHVKPGKGNTFMRTKLKDVVNGYVLERRFNIGEKLEDVRVERRPHQYLYHDGDNYQFMNQETFDQIPIAHDLINGLEHGDYFLFYFKFGHIRRVLYIGFQRTKLWNLIENAKERPPFHYFRKGLTVGKHASPAGGTPFTPGETPFTIGGKGLYNMG